MQPADQLTAFNPSPQKSASNIPRILVALIAVVSFGAAVWLFTQNQSLQAHLDTTKNDLVAANTQIDGLKNESPRFATGKDDASRLTAKLSRMMVLPANEDPTITRVADITKLSDQPFFVDAQNGDYIVIYANAQKAVLFRESNNKIINVNSITLGVGSGL